MKLENTRRQRVLLVLTGATFFVLLWYVVTNYLFTRPEFAHFDGFLPQNTFQSLVKLLGDSHFWSAALASLQRIFIGIMIAFVIGVPLGLITGRYVSLRYFSYPMVQFFRMISPLSWMPIAVLLFATFEGAIYFLIAISCIWPILLNTAQGVRKISSSFIEMARNQGASEFQLFTKIIVPFSFPYIFLGFRLAVGVAWIVLVPAEFLGISSGLGYSINDARDSMEYDTLLAIVIAIGMIGFALDGLLSLAQKAFPWERRI